MEESLINNLIPGLPNEVAMLCLARLPFGHHPLLSCVCRSWRRALQLPLLFSIRAQLGLQEPFVFAVVPVDEASHIEHFNACLVPLCYLIDPRLAKCYPLTLPPRVLASPCFYNFYFDIIALGRQIFILPKREYSPQSWDWEPLCFDVVSRLWCTHVPPPMLESRSHFASATMDGYVYAAGGYGVHGQCLETAERFNLASKKWERIPDMTERTAGASGLAWKGSFYVYGGWNAPGSFTCNTSAQVWDAFKEEWQLIPGFCLKGMHSLATVKGKLYALKYGQHEDIEVMWLDEKAKHWIPLGSFPQGAISQEIFGVGDELWLVANDFSYKGIFLATDPESLPLCWRRLPFHFDGCVSKFCIVTL